MKKLFFSLFLILVAFSATAQICPDNQHPHMIDLGLPSGTKWACCNVGAIAPEYYGDHYAWGETVVKELYDESTYKYYQYEKYIDIGSDISGTKYDVAHVKWGGAWQMPSKYQMKELIEKCSYIYVSLNDVYGCLFIGKNGKCIFLPSAGSYEYSNTYSEDYGNYWSSSLGHESDSFAEGLNFSYKDGDSPDWDEDHWGRQTGHTVRPVAK